MTDLEQFAKLTGEPKPVQLFQAGDKVIVTILDIEYRMVVSDLFSHTKENGVWVNKYHLKFTKKDGTPNRARGGRFFTEDRLKKITS